MYIFLVCCLSTKMWPKSIDFCRFFMIETSGTVLPPTPHPPQEMMQFNLLLYKLLNLTMYRSFENITFKGKSHFEKFFKHYTTFL